MSTNRAAPVVWLASYPRSGNTFLRTLLWHCFGLRSGSVYPADFGNNLSLAESVGHIEQSAEGQLHFPPNNVPLIKTHDPPTDNHPAIYIVRNGQAAILSLWQFYQQTAPLEIIIRGQHPFGTWAGHLEAWQPWARPHTLLIRYEDLQSKLPDVLTSVSHFLGYPILNPNPPERDYIAAIDASGQWVTPSTAIKPTMPPALHPTFEQINGLMMRHLGYR